MANISYVKRELTIDGFGSIYYFEHGKNFYHPPEQHDSWEIVYIDKGRIIAITDGVASVLEEGTAIFHEPNDVHSHISDGEVSNNMFVVTFVTQSPAMDFFKKKTFLLDEDSKKLLVLFLKEAKNALGEIQGDYLHRRRLEINSGEIFASPQLLTAYLEEFLIKLIRRNSGIPLKLSEESREMAKNSTVRLISDFMKRNLNNTLSENDICQKFFIGKTQLNHIFKKYLNASPMRFFNNLKIEEARRLLRESEMSISEISEELSFSSVHAFSRAFKSATNFSPQKYRNSIF